MRRPLGKLTGLILLLLLLWAPGQAWAQEKLYVCRPCSRDFIPLAERVIADMGLDLELAVKATGCLGPCGAEAVVEFRDQVHWGMDETKLRDLLEAAFPDEKS